MKLTQLFISALMILACAGIMNAQAVQSGSFKAGSDSPDYTLDKGTGDRSFSIPVKFDKPFAGKPDIIVSATGLDANTKETNLRYDVSFNGANGNGFTIVVKTWGDSKLFVVNGKWMAVAAGSSDAPKATKKKK